MMIRRGHSHIYSNAGDEGTRVWGPTPDRAHGGTMDYSFANRAVAHPAPAVVSGGCGGSRECPRELSRTSTYQASVGIDDVGASRRTAAVRMFSRA